MDADRLQAEQERMRYENAHSIAVSAEPFSSLHTSLYSKRLIAQRWHADGASARAGCVIMSAAVART